MVKKTIFKKPHHRHQSNGGGNASGYRIFRYNPKLSWRIIDECHYRPSATNPDATKEQLDMFLTAPVDGYLPKGAGWDWRETHDGVDGFFETVSFFQRADARFKYKLDLYRAGAHASICDVMRAAAQGQHGPGAIGGSAATLIKVRK